jgi:mannosylglucosylglycerate synthase
MGLLKRSIFVNYNRNSINDMKTAILHYSVPPVVGGVESVINAHANQFVAARLPLKIIAGRGDANALPQGVEFLRITEIDSMNPEIAAVTAELNNGNIPGTFNNLVDRLANKLRPELKDIDHLIVHNVLTKHFNLPLTAALFLLMNEGVIRHTVAWCHDLSWSSPNSRSKVFPSYPWNLLKTFQPNTTYVAISKKRQEEIVETFGCTPEKVRIIHNGVDPHTLFALSDQGTALIDRMGLLAADLILLMPVRVTEAKNIEFAIRVVASIKSLNCCPKLIVTGPPDPHDKTSMSYYESLLKLRHDLNLDNDIHFVFGSGPDLNVGYKISNEVVSELYRVADAMFMPSHREGFGMPILEAGLLGMPIISTSVPVVQDLNLTDALIYSNDIPPLQLAEQILNWINSKPEHRLRVKVRQNFTWDAIFEHNILPLLLSEC